MWKWLPVVGNVMLRKEQTWLPTKNMRLQKNKMLHFVQEARGSFTLNDSYFFTMLLIYLYVDTGDAF